MVRTRPRATKKTVRLTNMTRKAIAAKYDPDAYRLGIKADFANSGILRCV
jgi:hypothetical protein